MNVKRSLLVVIAMVALFVFQNCSNNNTEENELARVQLKLVDSEGDYLEVWVNIVDIQYNSSDDEEGWRSFDSFEGPVMVDLTELVAGNSILLTDELMPAGMMKQIRLILGDGNYIIIEEENESPSAEIALDTPSAQQSGLKLKLDQELEAGFSYKFILDWDVQKSIVRAGNSGKYNLKPVIRVMAEANTGGLTGVIEGDKNDDEVDGAVPLENVVVNLFKSDQIGDEPFATTLTNSSGEFFFEGLPTIEYEIKIAQEGFEAFEIDDISVLIDQVTDVGILELVVEVP